MHSTTDHAHSTALTAIISHIFHESHHPLSQIEDLMGEISNAYPQTASLISIGRNAKVERSGHFCVDYGERKKKKKKKRLGRQSEKLGFVIQGAKHAREVF